MVTLVLVGFNDLRRTILNQDAQNKLSQKEILPVRRLTYNTKNDGSVAKNKITLLPTIMRFDFSQRRFSCLTKNGLPI